MEEDRRADDGSSDHDVQHDRSGEVLAEPVAIKVFIVVGLEVRCDGPLRYGFSGCVTMLMFVMPACLTASMTEAKAPKGTRSSARR